MKRRQQLRELEAAEAECAERRLALRQSAGARVDDLRYIHPGWLIAIGVASGAIVHQCAGAITRQGLGSSLLASAFRLGRFVSSAVVTGMARLDV